MQRMLMVRRWSNTKSGSSTPLPQRRPWPGRREVVLALRLVGLHVLGERLRNIRPVI